MKKTKFLSLLVFAPLLVGCGSNTVKAPKFAKYGSSVKYDKFFKDFGDKFNKAKFSDEKAKLGSFVASTGESGYDEQVITRGKKESSRSSNFAGFKLKYSFDSESLVSKSELKQTMEEKEKSKTVDNSSLIEYETPTLMQVSSIEGKKHLVYVTPNTKEYQDMGEVTKDDPADEYFNEMNKMQIAMNINDALEEVYYSYESASDEGKKEYKFYENGNIFTAEWAHEEKLTEPGFKGTSSQQWTVQVDMTEGKWSAISYKEFVVEGDAEVTDGDYIKGDHFKETTLTLVEAKAQLKSVKVAAQDLKDYKLVA
jgi:hypothetical protein